jgi:hypothetical protein
MLRTPWCRLAQRGVLSVFRRLIARQFQKLHDIREQALRGGHRPRRGFTAMAVPWQAEVLEARLLLTPVASNDSYSGYHDHKDFAMRNRPAGTAPSQLHPTPPAPPS